MIVRAVLSFFLDSVLIAGLEFVYASELSMWCKLLESSFDINWESGFVPNCPISGFSVNSV